MEAIRIYGSDGRFLYAVASGSRIQRKEKDGTDTVLTLAYVDPTHFRVVAMEDRYGRRKTDCLYHVMEFGTGRHGERWTPCGEG